MELNWHLYGEATAPGVTHDPPRGRPWDGAPRRINQSHQPKGYAGMSEQEQISNEALTLTIPETARLLGISLSKTYEAARLGQIPTIRLGTRVLVSRRRLEEFVDGQTS